MLLDAFQNVSAKTENTTVNSNSTVYSVRGSGLYAVAINVGATTVYTYCDLENADQLNRILYAIDYLPDEGDPT